MLRDRADAAAGTKATDWLREAASSARHHQRFLHAAIKQEGHVTRCYDVTRVGVMSNSTNISMSVICNVS